jgi:hypothetical protein
MKSYILVSAVLFIFFTGNTRAQMPVEEGNRWDYESSIMDPPGVWNHDTTIYYALSDTLMPNAKLYNRVRPVHMALFGRYMRADSLGVWFYYPECNDEWLMYSYTAEVGEELTVPHWGCDTSEAPAHIKKIEDTTRIIFQDDTVRYMRFTYDGGVDHWYITGLSPELGFVDIGYDYIGFNSVYLLGCKLSGKVYGTLVSADDPYIILKYDLLQNFPNPFNPFTTIRYSLSSRDFVSLKIYDLTGRETAVLVNEEKPAGDYQVEWQPENLSSGVYMYRLVTGSTVISRKMIFLK